MNYARCTRLFVMVSLLGGALAAADAPIEYFGRQPGDTIHILPAELFDENHKDHGLPDLGYPNHEPWQALVCARQCSLVGVKLEKDPVTVTPYDGDPILGQTLALDHKPRGTLIALLRGLPGKAEPATRTYAGMTGYPTSKTAGTLEIDIPESGGARIVPRLPREAKAEASLNVYLELGGRRQLLGVLGIDGIAGYEGLSVGARLLRWAGDLDGDGKLDLIMNFSSRFGEEQSATLFLSSAATEGELVHPVARFGYFPVESAGC